MRPTIVTWKRYESLWSLKPRPQRALSRRSAAFLGDLCESASPTPPTTLVLLPSDHSLRRPHVLVAVVNSHHDHMLRSGRDTAFSSLEGHFEIVVFRLRIRKLAHRLHVIPLSGIHRVLGALDLRKAVSGAESHMNRSALHRSRQILDSRRSRIHLKSPAYLLRRQSFTGRMRWRVGSHNFHRVTAVRQQTGVERIGLIGQIVLQQEPARFAV